MKPLVVITGASSGIGESCARLFSDRGHALLLIARRLERMQALNLPNCLCEVVDVTDLNAFQAAVRKAESIYGPAECIINNAGVMLLGKAHSQDPTEWATMLQVNVIGVMNGVRAVIDGMMSRKSGTVINISSVAGRKTFGSHGVYCATKFGVHALTETFREEYSKYNVKFVVVAPGWWRRNCWATRTMRPADCRLKTKIEPLQPIDVANACVCVRAGVCCFCLFVDDFVLCAVALLALCLCFSLRYNEAGLYCF